MSNYILVKYSDNWADEMDLKGFLVTTQEDWEERLKNIEETGRFPYRFCVGTNEEIEYDSFKHYEYSFTVVNINITEYFSLRSLFGDSYGFFPNGPEAEEGEYDEDLDEISDDYDTCTSDSTSI